ncbi:MULTISPECIES: DUF4912 domain-containing protein [unclassified Fibrobacter]|uniref:DUF4912 domain-containing protein n=1 Tax=unclassified Fibrobacter TaxID=2634177 RepID=UPI000D6D41B9|nr:MULTISPECIES: DUF4912 domain-containing protein [unclassified Fibrobacter]PWJ71771.1 hypothetical protein BGX12_1015 [Fibrobacter sp. UWR4]PZW73686.1 hypothetical protein C8E88_10025 [Fibrobacter sp. UWR1]
MAAKKETEIKEKKVAAVAKGTTKAAVKAKPAVAEKPAKEVKAKAEKVEKAPAKAKAAAKSAPKAAAAKVAEPAEKKPAAKKTAAKTATKAPAKAKSAAKTSTKAAAAKATPKAKEAEVKVSTEETISALAQSFDAEYLVLMQKDPNWMHAFWEVSENRIKQAKKGKKKLVLRLFDIASDLTVQRNKKKQKFRDIEVPADARSWYVENTAGQAVVAVLGSVQGKSFEPIVESSPVAVFDKNAAAPAADDAFAKASLGGNTLGNFMSSGFTSQTAESWLNSLGGNFGSSSESMFSGALSSAALQALGSNAIETAKDSVNYGKDFFLWVKTRLIVYGGTRPDAHLQVRGEDFPLNPDGTFSFEEDLPDVTKVIPVFATDKDGDFPTTIVPIVVKRTE